MITFLPLPFHFLRHGETDWNRDGRVMGRKDLPLNDRGREQAAEAARRLTSADIGAILCSPLARCRQTADLAADSLALPVTVVADLAERCWGVYEGQTREVRASRALGDEGIETWQDFAARTTAALSGMAEWPRPLVIAHSGTYRVLLAALGRPRDETGATNGRPVFFAADGRITVLD